MENVLDGLSRTHPKSAEILRSLLFTFDDIVKLNPKSLTALFDAVRQCGPRGGAQGDGVAVPHHRPVLPRLPHAGMVEQELSGGEPATQREVNEARRRITDMALAMGQRGEIDLATGDEDGALVQ